MQQFGQNFVWRWERPVSVRNVFLVRIMFPASLVWLALVHYTSCLYLLSI